MKKDNLGTRMKKYEKCYDIKFPRRTPVVIRIDGKSFHTMVKRWKCEKPFDQEMLNAMVDTTKALCENISGCEIGYVQSDEISLLLRNDQDLNTEPWFDNKLQKIVSVSAAMATKYFIWFYFFHKDASFGNSVVKITDLPAFDCRAWILPTDEVCNYFIWRQQDASRNSVQMLARSLYSHKECNNKNCSELQELIFKKGQNWNDLTVQKRRGTCVIKKPVEIKNDKGTFVRNKWVVDLDIPIFTQNRDYINKRLGE